MPKTSIKVRTRLRRTSPFLQPFLILTPLLLCAVLGGCSSGDFGRVRADARNDDMHRWVGAEATGSVGLKASAFQLTDQERSLRAQRVDRDDRSDRPSVESAFREA